MKTIWIVITVAVLLGGIYYLNSREVSAPTSEVSEERVEQPNQGKLDINVVCEGALAYMTFPDGESAEQFVAECKAGEHPEVIERYKAEMNVGADAAI